MGISCKGRTLHVAEFVNPGLYVMPHITKEKMQYQITCPFCRGKIRIQHAGEGIWAISVDEMAYESCAAFVFNLGTFCDSTSDEDILQLLDTIGCETINGEAVV